MWEGLYGLNKAYNLINPSMFNQMYVVLVTFITESVAFPAVVSEKNRVIASFVLKIYKIRKLSLSIIYFNAQFFPSLVYFRISSTTITEKGEQITNTDILGLLSRYCTQSMQWNRYCCCVQFLFFMTICYWEMAVFIWCSWLHCVAR